MRPMPLQPPGVGNCTIEVTVTVGLGAEQPGHVLARHYYPERGVDQPVRGTQPRRGRRPRKAPDAATAPRPVAWPLTNTGRAGAATHAVRFAWGPAIERSTAEPGSTMAACGLTPALRINVRTSVACAGVCTV